jgi:sugar phosphate isomerase/epimerase
VKTSIRASMRRVRNGDQHPLQWAFERGSELGFDGLELCLGADRNSFVSAWSDELRQETVALVREHDLSIFSLSSDWAWAYAVFFPALKDWSRGVEFLAEDARLARDLGAHTILMHFATSKGSWEDCKALLKDVAAAGEQYGIRFGYEANIWERIELAGFQGLLRMADEVGSPYFGVYLHNAYPRAGLPLEREIEQAGKRLVPVMHSSSLTSGQVEIDFEKAIPAMKEHFADGVYTFEVPWEVAEENKQVIDQMIARYW